MRDFIFYFGLVVLFLLSLGLLKHARDGNVCGCIVNATVMICLTISLVG